MQEITALINCLFMRIDGLNILQGSTWIHQKIMIDFQPECTDNGEVVPDHKIINLGNGSCGGVFNGENSILANSLFNGRENIFKTLEVLDIRTFENLFTGNLGVSAFHALAGHNGILREQLWCGLDGILNPAI